MLTLSFFHWALFAEIAWPSPKAKRFPGTAEKNVSLKVSNYCLYIRFRIKKYQDPPAVSIQNLSHLFWHRGKRRTNQALTVTITSELAFQPDPMSSFYIRR
jgi:hypothetical protein